MNLEYSGQKDSANERRTRRVIGDDGGIIFIGNRSAARRKLSSPPTGKTVGSWRNSRRGVSASSVPRCLASFDGTCTSNLSPYL